MRRVCCGPQTFQLVNGEQRCVTIRVAAVPGDHKYTQINHQGRASAAVQWTRWGDVVDGQVGFPAPTWILTRTGNTSYWAHGALQPGQQACAGAGARHSTIEAFIGQRMASVTISNAVTTMERITDTYASLFEFNFFWF